MNPLLPSAGGSVAASQPPVRLPRHDAQRHCRGSGSPTRRVQPPRSAVRSPPPGGDRLRHRFLQVLGKRLGAPAGSTACSPRRCRWTQSSQCGSTRWWSTSPCSAPQGWAYLEKVCTRAAAPRRGRVHRAVLRGAARARAAARRRRLGHQAVPPGGADRSRRGRRAAAQARRRARSRARRWSASSRSGPTSSRLSSGAHRSS